MYLIVNTTKKIVSLGDLKVSLEGHQMVDLDKWKSLPMKPEDSKDLQANVRSGNVKIMKHDRVPLGYYKEIPAPVEAPPKPVKPEPSHAPVLNEEKLASSLMGPLQEFIRKEVSKIANKAQPAPQADQSQILNAIGQLQKMIKTSAGSTAGVVDEVEVEVDEDKMVEMHAKTVSSMAKNVVGDISHETEKKQDASLVANVDELDGLL